jgi:hypothetical protein
MTFHRLAHPAYQASDYAISSIFGMYDEVAPSETQFAAQIVSEQSPSLA